MDVPPQPRHFEVETHMPVAFSQGPFTAARATWSAMQEYTVSTRRRAKWGIMDCVMQEWVFFLSRTAFISAQGQPFGENPVLWSYDNRSEFNVVRWQWSVDIRTKQLDQRMNWKFWKGFHCCASQEVKGFRIAPMLPSNHSFASAGMQMKTIVLRCNEVLTNTHSPRAFHQRSCDELLHGREYRRKWSGIKSVSARIVHLDIIEIHTRMMMPKPLAGSSKLTQDSIWLCWMLKRGEITPVLLRRPFSWTTILPERWSSMISNSPM